MVDNIELANFIEKTTASLVEKSKDFDEETEKLEEFSALLNEKYETLNTHLTELSKMAGEDENDILKKVQSIARKDGDPSEIVELLLVVIQDLTDLIDTKDMVLDKTISSIGSYSYIEGQKALLDELIPLLPKTIH